MIRTGLQRLDVSPLQSELFPTDAAKPNRAVLEVSWCRMHSAPRYAIQRIRILL